MVASTQVNKQRHFYKHTGLHGPAHSHTAVLEGTDECSQEAAVVRWYMY